MADAKKKIKVDVAIFIAVFVALLFLCFSPLLAKLLETTKELANRKALLKSLEEQIAVLQDFQNNNLVYQENIKKLDSSFISSEAPVEFIGFLEELAKKYGLEISLSSVKDTFEKKESRVTTSFQATIIGDYPIALAFLKKLEQSPWLIKVDQVDIDRVEKDSKVTLKLGLKTFSNYLEVTP
jgi:hypothetical protein